MLVGDILALAGAEVHNHGGMTPNKTPNGVAGQHVIARHNKRRTTGNVAQVGGAGRVAGRTT
jgi:hypothetical protein